MTGPDPEQGRVSFAGTTGGEVFCSEDNGESWKLITSTLAPISKKGHEKLLAAS